MSPTISRANTFLIGAVAAFTLGGFSVEFSGSWRSWVTLTISIVAIGVSGFILARGGQRPTSR